MRQKAVFYHAGCPVCLDVERQLADSLDPVRFELEVVHLGNRPDRVKEAEAAGVKSVPALLLSGNPLHINFGASIADLR